MAMPKLLLPLVTVAVVLAGALLLAACESEEEGPTATASADAPAATPAAETPTAQSSEPPGGAGGGDSRGTVVPVTPSLSPKAVPEEWPIYTDPSGRFSLQYPDTWFVSPGGSIYSWDYTSWDKPYFPAGSTKIDAVAVSLDTGFTGCGALPDSAAVSLGGIEGWQTVYTYDLSVDAPGIPDESRITRSREVAADHGGYRFCITANFAQTEPDDATFMQIVGSFRLTK